MAVDIKTATLEDYRDMMLRPTKLNETAQVLYDLAQQSDGSLIEIGTSKKEIEALQNRMKNAENDISYLTDFTFSTDESYISFNIGGNLDTIITKDNSIDNKYIIVRRGKKKYYLVNIKY